MDAVIVEDVRASVEALFEVCILALEMRVGSSLPRTAD